MVKKSYLVFMFIILGLFAFTTAHADQIDGLASNSGPQPPSGLNLYVNPGDLGDALVYGYYNVRGNYNYFRVVNTSESTGIAAKVRLREGRNSNEVLDFAICLSAGDQFSFWVIGDADISNPGTLIWYDDDTPTYPDPNGNSVVTDNWLASIPLHYSTTGGAASVTADDTKEGYLEIIGGTAWPDTPGNRTIDTPSECAEAAGIASGPLTGVDDVPNTLMGNGYIFNLAEGAGTFAYNATALASFSNAAINISLASDSPPRLDNSTDVNGNGTGIDEVNFVLTKAKEYALYDVDTWFGGTTDIINTFPTKRLSIDRLDDNGPFNDDAVIESDGKIGDEDARCELVKLAMWDDAENRPETTTGFSPGETPDLYKCDEVSVIVVGGASALPMLDSNLVQFILSNAGFNLGWIGEDFTTVSGRTTDINGTETTGLPVISYEMQGFFGGGWTHMLPLRYSTQISTD